MAEQHGKRRPRTAAATAARMRASETRKAQSLDGRGWACAPPDHPNIDLIRSLIAGRKTTEDAR